MKHPEEAGSHRPGHTDDPLVLDASADHAPALVLLISAEWALPARPAVTVLTELQRRWDPRVTRALVAEAIPSVLDSFSVDRLPTWILLRPQVVVASEANHPAAEHDPDPRDRDHAKGPDSAVRVHPGDPACTAGQQPTARTTPREWFSIGHEAVRTSDGSVARLLGSWQEVSRLVGATPKHAVADAVAQYLVDDARL